MASDYRKCPEYWKPIPNKPPYEVSTHGRFRNSKTGREKKVRYCQQTLVVSLMVDGTPRTFAVRSLVWRAFVGEIPKGMRVASKSRAKNECYLEELELVNNVEWGRYRGKCNGKHVIKIGPDGKVIKLYHSTTEAAEKNNYAECTMSHRCKYPGSRKPAADGCDYAYEDDPKSIRRALTRLGIDWRKWRYE